MSENYTRLADTLSGTEGKAYITMDGVTRELFEISAFSAQIELTVQGRRMGGHRMTQHKVVGGEGTGSMTLYFMNSQLLQSAISYIRQGRYGGITLQVRNEDPQSSVGKQEIKLYHVILASIPVAQLDDQSEDPLTFETDFTFDDVEGLTVFDVPENYRS